MTEGETMTAPPFPIDEAVDAAARVRFARTVQLGEVGPHSRVDADRPLQEHIDAHLADLRDDLRPDIVAAATPIEIWLRRRIAGDIRDLADQYAGQVAGISLEGEAEALRGAARMVLGDLADEGDTPT
jgi:hypothetical protein